MSLCLDTSRAWKFHAVSTVVTRFELAFIQLFLFWLLLANRFWPSASFFVWKSVRIVISDCLLRMFGVVSSCMPFGAMLVSQWLWCAGLRVQVSAEFGGKGFGRFGRCLSRSKSFPSGFAPGHVSQRIHVMNDIPVGLKKAYCIIILGAMYVLY